MQRLTYSITIKAPAKKVWETMLEDKTYREWTSAFSEGGYYEGSWEKGSKIRFIGPDPQTGEASGMVSRIADNRPYEYISIEHLGVIQGGIEDTTSELAKKWSPAFENYTFTERDGVTQLDIELDSDEENAPMFNEMWPKGLQKLKELSERE